MTIEEISASGVIHKALLKLPFLENYVFNDCLQQNDTIQRYSLRASNLDDNWEYPNRNNVKNSIPLDEALSLENYYNKPNSRSSTFQLGFDEISWFGEKVSPGTYGYIKANGAGNYLSNSIILSKNMLNKNTVVSVSIEQTSQDLSKPLTDVFILLQKIKMIFGNPRSISTHCAPSTEAERTDWILKREKTDAVFERIINNIPAIIQKLPYFLKSISYQELVGSSLLISRSDVEEISARNLFYKAFKNSSWQRQDDRFVRTDKSGNKASFSAFIDERGHRVQAFLLYDGPYFRYHFGGIPHLEYFLIRLKGKEEIDQYFHNLHIIIDWIIDIFSDEVEKIYGHVPEGYYPRIECK